MPLAEFLGAQQQSIDAALDRLTPPESALPETIHRAMRYSLFAGGKRIRPILCLQAAAAVSGQPAATIPGAMNAACSLEMIHTYSLIHDDLRLSITTTTAAASPPATRCSAMPWPSWRAMHSSRWQFKPWRSLSASTRRARWH
jgi:hypothetical protein